MFEPFYVQGSVIGVHNDLMSKIKFYSAAIMLRQKIRKNLP
ncbi:hypothetical protein UUU_00240 [Klebsiella pneumoniae subsp. pneumoniae DSM 30104 = JCM 1662 = NBRC 14940]|nr:hypothetical protein UUU_00240 [Klebsiella pneumoniae subsp. pneumoniae DSM 30104 = JCM 1662 = NBRC 14940]